MTNAKMTLSKRCLAVALSVLMVFSAIPFAALPVLAATQEQPDAVTITVADESGNAIQNATVDFTVTSATQTDPVAEAEGVSTDENGCVVVLSAAEYEAHAAGELTLTAQVSKDGFVTDDSTIAGATITDAEQNFEVVLQADAFAGITVEGKTGLTYTGEPKELVTVTEGTSATYSYEILSGDAVLNEEKKPVATNAGDYTIRVTATKDGATKTFEVAVTIAPAEIEVELTPAENLAYNGQEQELVTVSGQENIPVGSTVTWYLGDEVVGNAIDEIPTASAIGTSYTVKLVIESADTNYNKFVETCEGIAIEKGSLDLGDLVISGLNSTYTVENGIPVAQRAVTVEGQTGEYTLYYILSDKNAQNTTAPTPEDARWAVLDETSYPTVTDAGSYIVWVKAIQENYNDSMVDVTPAASAIEPYNVYVAKAQQEMVFTSPTEASTTLQGTKSEFPKKIQFTAENQTNTSGIVSYTVELAEGAPVDISIDEVATIDPVSGELTILSNGEIIVKATTPETDNYQECSIEHNVTTYIESDYAGQFVKFDLSSINYELGTNDGKTPVNNASPQNEGIGSISYRLEEAAERYGLEIAHEYNVMEVRRDYFVQITDYQKLTKVLLENNGTLTVTVFADKAECWGQEDDSAYYLLNISFAPAPTESVYKVSGTLQNGWYNGDVMIAANDASQYTVSASAEPETFAASYTIKEDCVAPLLYLRNNAGGICAPVTLTDVKIDKTAPDANTMSVKVNGIDMSELTFLEKLGLWFGFYNPEVELEFIVADEIGEDESGVDYIKWYYVGEETPSTSEVGGTIEAEKQQDEEGNAYYSATLALPLQEATELRSKIALEAYDVAGNVSKRIQITKDGTPIVFVVDTISPKMSAAFQAEDENGVYQEKEVNGITKHYFNGNVAFTFTINEANFFEEDVTIQAEKDGATLDAQALGVQWTSDPENQAVHYGTFTLSGDGDYVVTLTYRDGQGDNSGNVLVDASTGETIETYVSETIVIDTAPAAMAFDFVEHKDDETETENFQAQKTILTVTEQNFDPQNLFVEPVEADESLAKDIVDNQIEDVTAEYLNAKLQDPDNWSVDDGAHVFETDDYVDGIYNFNIIYDDSVTEATTVNAAFTIDHNAPTEVKIEFVTDPLDTFLEIITLGFYNSPVEIKFTTTDDINVVEKFDWAYTKTEGASTTNAASFGGSITEGIVQEGNTFTATVTLPAAENEETQQLLGYISASATDAYKNKSTTTEDADSRFVYDTIAPSMTVSYNAAQREVTTEAGDVTRAYYNGTTGDVTAAFTVTEANFIAEDVEIAVTRDGEAFIDYTLSWENEDFTDKWGTETGAETADRYVGMLTLPAPADHSGDGDYVITVEYPDRSTNEMEAYTSHMITIDTIAPEIDVLYEDEIPVNTLQDDEGNTRSYFDDTQTATVTITEHNFDPDDVQFTIRATDVTGAELNADELHEKTDWRVDSTGDIHTITIAYPGDANYTFDVDYADLATNAADDYQPDYFTVDKTAPTNLTVSYSTSVLDTVLESLSFGFYNAKMTVTLTADDITSGVHSFKYSYLNAAGVSGVNAELIDQAIEAADIVCSEDGLTGTATFEIPKLVLQSDNQFNGTVNFTAYDRANNETSAQDTKRIVVDSIAPTATVTYNTPVNTENGVSYYDGEVNATVTVTEANFYAQDVSVMVSRDGGAAYAVTPTWQDENTDVHIGTFTLSGDGDYVITINYQDKSSNQMVTYTSNQLTIDTDIQAPTYAINGVARTEEGGAYKNEATISFNFEDINFDTNTIRLTRTRFDTVEDVTAEFINAALTAQGGSGSFSIPAEVGYDGIYDLTISMTDKANHTTESSLRFTINRFGSVYEYSDYLTSLIQDGGQYITIEGENATAITQDLVITEYNASQLLAGSLQILITRDGENIEAQYTATPAVDGNAGIGESGWYQYVYTIAQENFAEDGVYRITLASAYTATDSEQNESSSVPENSIDSAGNAILDTINFTVDTTAPEIRNIVNMENAIVNAQSLDVRYTVVDVGGLQSVEVIVNGNTVDTITDFGESAYNYSGQFTLTESSAEQTVRLIVTDRAGNVTDTASEEFNTGDLYVFNDTITVSTNFFVRWYANTPLFWGSIAGVVVLVGLIWFLVAYKRRKKEEK